MNDLQPFILPLELVQEWKNTWHKAKVKHYDLELFIAMQAVRWGADKELEACMEWLDDVDLKYTVGLCIARRPLVQRND